MKYKSIIVNRRGGPEVFCIVENELHEPSPHEVRIKALAVPVCLPDVTARYGQTPFCPKLPFSPGYAVIGTVDAIGKDVTNVSISAARFPILEAAKANELLENGQVIGNIVLLAHK